MPQRTPVGDWQLETITMSMGINKKHRHPACCGRLQLFETLCVVVASMYFVEPLEFKLTSAKSKLIAVKVPSCQHNYILLTWKVTIYYIKYNL